MANAYPKKGGKVVPPAKGKAPQKPVTKPVAKKMPPKSKGGK